MLTPDEPRWHGKVRVAFMIAFILVWLEAVSCFAYFQMLLRKASPVPSADLAATVTNHSRVFYVTLQQKQTFYLLLAVMKFAIPAIMLTAVLLHHAVGVKIFNRRS